MSENLNLIKLIGIILLAGTNICIETNWGGAGTSSAQSGIGTGFYFIYDLLH